MAQWTEVSDVGSGDGGWGISKDDPRCQVWIESDRRVVTHYLPINQGWLSIETGVKVSIEVHSDLKDSEEECPACRSLVFMGCLSVPDLLSFLCYSTVGTSSRSCASPCSCRGAYSFIVSQEHVACRLE
jgi:hypothetical protein